MQPLFGARGWAAVCRFSLGGNSSSSSSSSVATSSGGGSPNSTKGPYPDDGARRMPIMNSLSALEAGRRQRAAIIAKSGRSSTRLASAGTASYVNNSVGGVG